MTVPNQFTIDYTVIPATGVKSLVWISGKLVDCVSGNVEYGLDGSKRDATVIYPYRFDAAVASPSGDFIALYERLGTKAVVIGPNDLFREINRSYYHAHVYEYPILFCRLADGREALAHCPDEYCEIQIEDPVSGTRWTKEGAGRIQSMFHSRLAANPAGTRILSAGWVWHPFDTVRVFDLNPTVEKRLALLPCDNFFETGTEITSAVFNPNGHLIVTSDRAAEDFNDDEPGERLRPGTIGVFDLDEQKLFSLAPLEDDVGTVFAVGDRHVLGLFDHPKLIEVSTGRVLCRWPELKTGQQSSSIMWHKPLPPPIAYDGVTGRLAVANGEKITVVSLAQELLR